MLSLPSDGAVEEEGLEDATIARTEVDPSLTAILEEGDTMAVVVEEEVDPTTGGDSEQWTSNELWFHPYRYLYL